MVPFSGRWEAGITSTDVMKLATESAMRVKCVTLDVDENEATSDLIAFLTFLREKQGGRLQSQRQLPVVQRQSLFWMAAKRE